MKRNLSKTAFTLIELIVSALLIAIVLLGIFSINMVLNNNNQDYGQRYLVKSQTQTTLNHILNNASLAYGSANANDEGVLYGAPCPGAGVGTLGCADSTYDPTSLCIHQKGTGTPGGQNLINSAADIWLCYTWYPSTDANYPYQIRWCAETYGGVPDPRGASSCPAAITAGTVIPYSGNNTTYLGTAYSIISTTGTTLPNSPYFIGTSAQLLFSINILNCLNNATPPGTCSATGSSGDPTNNPEVQISGSVIPLQEST